jgi:hypothetical protein
MAEEAPGFIPRVLCRDDVSLLRADETIFNAMVDGWRAQMLAWAWRWTPSRADVASCLGFSNSLTTSRGGGARLILISSWRI